MEKLTGAPGTAADAVLALLGGCNSLTDGVELAYQALDLVVARYHLDEALLVLRPGYLGPQVFVHGRRHVTPDAATGWAQRPSGLYASPDVVPIAVQDALTGCCEMALAAHAARLSPGRGANGLADRPAMEEAVRRAASRGARFRWRTTLVLLGTAGPMPATARWQSLASAVRAARRVCDEAGVAGPGLAAAILADAGPEDVEAYVGRLRTLLDGDGDGGLELVIGTAGIPSESVDPDQLWRLCTQRAAEAAPEGASLEARSPRRPAVSELELELRCLPNVVSVGVTGLDDPDATVRSITVVARRPLETLQHDAAALAVEAQLADVPVDVLAAGSLVPLPGPTVEPADSARAFSGNGGPILADGTRSRSAAPPGGGPAGLPASAGQRPEPPVTDSGGATSRIVLLLCEFDRSTGTSEVSLAWRGTTAVGKAAGPPLAGAAQATLLAVEALGADVPYYLASVERATSDPRSPVVVALAARQPGTSAAGERRFGAAHSADEATAASRATLAALNRHLATDPSA